MENMLIVLIVSVLGLKLLAFLVGIISYYIVLFFQYFGKIIISVILLILFGVLAKNWYKIKRHTIVEDKTSKDSFVMKNSDYAEPSRSNQTVFEENLEETVGEELTETEVEDLLIEVEEVEEPLTEIEVDEPLTEVEDDVKDEMPEYPGMPVDDGYSTV